MNKSPLLILDGNNIAHRAYHANSGLSYKGKSTAVIFGVINILRTLVNTHKPKRVIVVWDGGRNEHRLNLLPGYKGKRKEKRDDSGFDYEDWNRQKTHVQKMIRRLGIGQVWARHMEADDYIYNLVEKFYGKYPIKIVSNDKDFHQLVSDNVSQLVNKINLGEVEISINSFDSDLMKCYPKIPFFNGITPSQYLDFLILTGDDSDNIPGMPGIGDKRGIAFIQEFFDITTYLSDPTAKGKIDKEKLMPIHARNRLLIDLQAFNNKFFRGVTDIEYLYGEKKGKANADKFKVLASKYNMVTFTKSTFLKTFGL